MRLLSFIVLWAGVGLVAAQGPTPAPPPAPDIPPETAAHIREIYAAGQAQGNRPNAFAKVGDSTTASPTFLSPIGEGYYELGKYSVLQGVIDHYSTARLRTGNSFNNASLAASVGWSAATVTNPAYRDFSQCEAGESPLACEYRYTRPAIALIMLGSNEVTYLSVEDYRANMARVVDQSIEVGVIPVISTIPPRRGNDEKVAAYNDMLRAFAAERRVPLWDYAAALGALPDDGMMADRLHPSAPPGNAYRGSVTFTPENLAYGFTVRNLTALQMLAAIRAVLGQG